MAYAYVNGWSNSANGNTVTVSPSAGNLLVMHVVTSLGGGDPTWTCDDNLTSGGYTVAFAAAAGTSTYRHGSGYKLNVASGVTTLTFTFNGGNPGEIFIKVFEYSGIATSSAYIGGVRNFQSAPGTSTDTLTSTAYNVASGVPALVAAVCAHDWHDSTPSAGTGWTSRYATGTRLEDVRATSTGNQTATFTAVNGTLDYCTILMAFSEPASATLEQEGFRWYEDNGSESTASAAANQDTNITAAAGATKRLRMLINATGDPATKQYKLQYKLSTAGTWSDIA